MKKFEAPELDVLELEVEDIITTSGFGGGGGGDHEMGEDEF